ncbi:MAG: peptide deformylase [Gemmatimonadota bacterium]|nr:peptide deformylase [Gemmatimonadota bacterium]
MAIRPIKLLGSNVLREEAAAIRAVDDVVRQLVRDLFDTMHADSGIGLAANQIGVARRVAVVQTEDDDAVILINPQILDREGTVRGEEGCLSIPDVFADVDRSRRIVLETTTLDDERVQIEASDLQARAIQHEIDHLDGVLFLDHLSPLKRRMLLKKWRKSRWAEMGEEKHVLAQPGSVAER